MRFFGKSIPRLSEQDRKNTLWNIVAGLINASEAVILTAFVSWRNDLLYAGILSIAFTLANLFMNVGKFGIRPYQVARVNDYSFRDFFVMRIITVSLMIVIIAVYTFAYYFTGRYTGFKSLVVALVCLWYATEAFEDVYGGHFQAVGRLDISSKIFSLRWVVTILVFIAADLIWGDILIAALTACICGIVTCWFLIMALNKRTAIDYSDKPTGVKLLFKEGLPVFISSFMYFFMTSIPKYVIDMLLNDEKQAIYGYISLPVFVISLAGNFIYQPQLVDYANKWNTGDIKGFIRKGHRQIFYLACIMLIALLGVFALGVPVPSWMYHTDLSMYKTQMVLHMLGSGFLAAGSFLSTIFVIMNRQKFAVLIFLIVNTSGVLMNVLLVTRYDIMGASVAYVVTMVLYAGLFYTFWRVILKRQKS